MFDKTTINNLAERRMLLEEMFHISIVTIDRYRAGVRQFKYRIIEQNNTLRLHYKYSKDSKFSYVSHIDALMAGVDWCMNYLKNKGDGINI